MEQQEGDTWTMPPFWAAEHRDRRRLRRSYSLLLTSTSLLVLFLVIALVFALIVVPTLHSFASIILRPRTVKNSWDSLNLVLVLFAIVCGFLSRNNTAETLTPRSDGTFSNPSTPPPPWYQYNYSQTPHRSFNRLRSFNSYPDLRQHFAADERFRFYDDTYLLRHRRPEAEELEEKEIVIQNVATAPPLSSPAPQPQAGGRNVKRGYQEDEKHETDDLDVKNSPPPLSPPPAATLSKGVRRNVKRTYLEESIEKHETIDLTGMNSQPPPAPPPPENRTKGVRRNVKRAYQAETVEKRETNELDVKNSQPALSPPSPPPPATTKGVRRNAKPERNDSVAKSSPPPPPPPPPLPAEGKTLQGKKKRGIATKEFLTSLTGKKKKKQRHRSVENLYSILYPEALFPQPPPPTPPPPPRVFQNLFSLNKGKHKKSHFVSVATTTISTKREHSSFNVMMAGNQSPLIPIPPPPPPPPFKLPAWKFRVQGDFVRVDSIGSSRSGSPDLDDVSVDTPRISTHDETSQCSSPFAKDGEESASVSAPSLFCPSPDVDTKAHNFIESFRAGLRMAKMNSMKERQGIGRSNLAPSPNHEWN